MRRKEKRGLPLGVELLDQVHQALCRLGVQVGCRLVRDHHFGVGHQGSRDRHALLLPAGKLAGPLPAAGGQADRFQRFGRPLAREAFVARTEKQRKLHVFEGGQHRHKAEILEHEPDLPVAQFRATVLVQLRRVLAVQQKLSGGRIVQQAQEMAERGLAGTRRAHERQQLARFDSQGNLFQGPDHEVAQVIGPADLPQFE